MSPEEGVFEKGFAEFIKRSPSRQRKIVANNITRLENGKQLCITKP